MTGRDGADLGSFFQAAPLFAASAKRKSCWAR
jgi:hypothetical protein